MNSEIIESFSMIAKEKGIDRDYLIGVVEEVFKTILQKRFGEEARFEVIVNMDRGDIECQLSRVIVETVGNPDLEISLDEVNSRGNEDELDLGDDYIEILPLSSFGRRLVLLAKNTLNQKIRDIEKEVIFADYKKKIGDIVIGEIYQNRKHDILVNHNKNELVLPKNEQIPGEKYIKGRILRAVIKEIRRDKGNPQVIISRADNEFLRRLFEIEIPEIFDGVIEIKAIARQPGMRAKVAVESTDKRVDAVGACIGMKGVRITSIVKELNGENIDVFNWSDDIKTLIIRALNPGKIKNIELDTANKKAIIYAEEKQAGTIVGLRAVNINLASRLTGYDIELIREKKSILELDEDIELPELREELGEELVNLLIENRYDTALDVLRAGKEKIAQIEGIDPDSIDELFRILTEQLTESEG
ncbi:MAG: transcription termination factor NusA [Ignavibacteriales bacterium]|nr:transcription termination factor NusA [Ignavibacteriaceae bacterium]QOJ30374.1 MAG: transcription termination factor NusA [Ignavibacteriales bacterium]